MRLAKEFLKDKYGMSSRTQETKGTGHWGKIQRGGEDKSRWVASVSNLYIGLSQIPSILCSYNAYNVLELINKAMSKQQEVFYIY